MATSPVFAAGSSPVQVAQEYAGYVAGREAQQKGQPQADVDGVGFAAMICAQLLCIIYPVAGTAAIGTGIVTWTVTGWLGIGKPGIGAQLVLSLLLAMVAFFFGFAVERRAARRKLYRVLRDCMRLGLGAVIPVRMMMYTGGRAGRRRDCLCHRAAADPLLHSEADRSCRRHRRDGLTTGQGP